MNSSKFKSSLILPCLSRSIASSCSIYHTHLKFKSPKRTLMSWFFQEYFFKSRPRSFTNEFYMIFSIWFLLACSSSVDLPLSRWQHAKVRELSFSIKRIEQPPLLPMVSLTPSLLMLVLKSLIYGNNLSLQ